MNSGAEKSIMTNPISEMLDKNSLGTLTDFPTDDSSSMNWALVIIGFIIFSIVVFMVYKHYTGGENIFENIHHKIKEIFESIKNRFHSSGSSSTSDIEQHMEDDHGIHTKDQNPSSVSSIPHATLPTSQSQDGETNKDNLNQALNQATPNYTPEPGYGADDSYSSIQKSKSSSKSGWCYIGEDRGFRSCIDVGENDTCMSGDIFPTSEICVNPNLRM
uniref:Uncharacterized protein n=1 Tax=viral metagenome TaxID=1070528 RepID=A0A6C0HAJ1_9ZZZZ